MGCMVIVLIPNGNNDTHSIGLLELLWKVVEAIIETCLRVSVCLHDILHGFHEGRGTGMAILELNLVQELSSIYQDPLFLVLLDIQKSYGTVNWCRLLMTLEG